MADNKRLIHLLQKFGTGKCTPEELQELNEWYERLEVSGYKQRWWQEDDPEVRKETAAYFKQFQQRNAVRTRWHPKWVWWSAAAAIILAVSATVLYLNAYRLENVHKTLVTENGAKTNLMLPDGSHVWLNSGSSIKYPQQFSKGKREIWLSGEGYFEVVKNAAMPFVVHTQRVDIKVLGTTFNVRAYDKEPHTETTLLTGSVEAWVKNKGVSGGERVMLKPGEKLLVQDEIKMRMLAGNSDTSADETVVLSKVAILPDKEGVTETQWVHNRLAFEQEPLDAIFPMLERWYNVKINCTIKTDTAKKFTGTFQGDVLTDVLAALQLKGNFRYRIEGQTVTVY